MITFRFSRFAEGWTLCASASGEPGRGCDSGGERGSVQSEWEKERERERKRESERELFRWKRMEEKPDRKGSWKRELRKRGKRQCSITTQPNGSTITAPILPAQLNYCVERPREISGIDIESVAAAAARSSQKRRTVGEGDEDEGRFDRDNASAEAEKGSEESSRRGGERKKRSEFLREWICSGSTKARFHGITFQ